MCVVPNFRLIFSSEKIGGHVNLTSHGHMSGGHVEIFPYFYPCCEELYLYNNDVTYYEITCNSAFEYNNDVTYYVITRNYQWTPEILTNNLLEAGCTNKLCPFQY